MDDNPTEQGIAILNPSLLTAFEREADSIAITSVTGQLLFVNAAFRLSNLERTSKAKLHLQPERLRLMPVNPAGLDDFILGKVEQLSVIDAQGVVRTVTRAPLKLPTGASVYIWRFAARHGESRYAEFGLALHVSSDGLWDWDLHTGVLRASRRAKEILGVTEDSHGGTVHTLFGQIHSLDRVRVKTAIRTFLKSRVFSTQCECRLKSGESAYRWYVLRACAEWDALGRPCRIAGSLTDIQVNKDTERQLTRQSSHDPLTGLANRGHFLKQLEEQLIQPADAGDFAVLFLDLDRFKIVNDSLGHAAGDALLIAIAGRLQTCLRPTDFFARQGGDEFVILLTSLDSIGQATIIAERLCEQFDRPFLIAGQEVFSSASIGIVWSPMGKARSTADLLRDADTAMYHAKASGKARYVMFDPEMHAKALNVLQLETDLRRAIDQRELEIHYQPIINMRTRKTDGFEALLRWPHVSGPISPTIFIPVAEETGLIIKLGEWVLREACAQAARWQKQTNSALNINVNVSPIQFAQPELVSTIANVLRETGVAPASVHLEITESAMMEGGELLKRRLEEIRNLGVRLLIDDFGTGYSSLSSLQDYPVDGLKIDRNFIARMGGSGEHAAIVRTITALAAHLDLMVTAEGVETDAQLAHLSNTQCALVQGHLFSAALPPKNVDAFLELAPPEQAEHAKAG